MISQRVQTIALSTTIALSIVAGGLALRFKVASQANSKPQPALSSPPESKRRNTATSNVAEDAPTRISSPRTESVSQPSAIEIAPVPPKSTKTEAASQPNHLPYEEADPARLQPAGTFVRENFERIESLDWEAANAFAIMVEEASAQGIYLMPISGFRTVADQQELFAKQTERYGSEAAAAQLSAPAEYSEHHTGYAIDIGDGDRPDTDLDTTFADTAAYQWLLNNAEIFGFEQSFPPNNPQGLSFEPWHWRYVQSERAAQVFAEARESAPKPAQTVPETTAP